MHAQSLVRLCDDVAVVQAEVVRLREASDRSTAAEVVAELRAQRLEAELASTRAEAAALRRYLVEGGHLVRGSGIYALPSSDPPPKGPGERYVAGLGLT